MFFDLGKGVRSLFWTWFFGIAAGCCLSVLVFFLIWGRWFRVASHTVLMPNLPKEFDGFRIAMISDLHDRRFGKNNSALVKAILNTHPDLVVTAGDLHEGRRPAAGIFGLFSGLSASVPVTYTEGNHDFRVTSWGITEAEYLQYLDDLSRHGATLLNNTAVPMERNGKILFLYGQSWKGMESGKNPEIDPGSPSILVCHDPLQFDRLESLPDLMLSGHVHGGILRLPWIGPVFAPGNGLPLWKRIGRRFFFPKYSRGLYYKGNHTLAVTQGVGFFVLPIRFLRPEIMVLTLKSDEKLNNS